MKLIFLLLAFPALVLAGQISGTVSDLNGTPIAGAVVASSAESDISKPSGSWILGRSAKVAEKAGSAVRVSSNLIVENGRPKLSWKGFGLDGRKTPTSVLPVRDEFASRSAVALFAPETLCVYWKGKRLVQLPIESRDTSGVAIQVDTAWKDDFGVPWNPKIKYGSLKDERDGQVYRTVKIGDQTWMAENLAYFGTFGGKDSIGACKGGARDSCQKLGRLYRWNEVISGVNMSDIAHSTIQRQGVCPGDWIVPRESDWVALVASIRLPDSLSHKVIFWQGERTGAWFRDLRSSQGWQGSGAEDPYGFRALHWSDSIAAFWSSNHLDASGPGNPDPLSYFPLGAEWDAISLGGITFNAVRCLLAVPDGS